MDVPAFPRSKHGMSVKREGVVVFEHSAIYPRVYG
jgi:hypothetical protein